MQWKRRSNHLTIRVRRWRGEKSKGITAMSAWLPWIIQETHVKFFLSLFFLPCFLESSLSGLTTYLKHYWENICDVLSSVALADISGAWWARQIPNTPLSLLIQRKRLNPVPHVTAEAQDKLLWQMHPWESQKLLFVWRSTWSCHSELSLFGEQHSGGISAHIQIKK